MKKSKIVNIAPEATHDSVYIFYNTKNKISLFVDACGPDEVYDIFEEVLEENDIVTGVAL